MLITNYRPDKQRSMFRFPTFLMEEGHKNSINYKEIYPKPILNNKYAPKNLKKWLGYADKFILFPRSLKSEFKSIVEQSLNNVLVHVADHSNSIYLPRGTKVSSILTCHDMIAIGSSLGKFQYGKSSKSGQVLQKMIRTAIPRANFIACDSYNTESELIKFCPEIQGRTKTIHLGIKKHNCKTRRPSTTAIDLDKIQFVLHVGNSAWYKNRKAVIESFSFLSQNSTYSNLHLILVGNPPQKEEVSNLCDNSKSLIEKKIHTFDNLSDSELFFLYERAVVLIFPSLMEGFGWPPLEAQSFGCPVIASSAGSLREILSDSALTTKPNDPKEIARKTSFLLKNPEMAKIIIRNGLKNAARFPIKDTVKKYSDLYREVLDRSKR